jgi:3-hydroxyisobutyrate dehydrogenase-like beta-hydroxyacid dehydrogenase
MEKDIDLILDVADENAVELPVAREMKALLRATSEAGYADDDFMALFRRLQSASRSRDQEVVR